MVQLKYPYPRGVSEPAIYLDANVLTDVDPAEFEAMQKPSTKASKATKFTNSLDFSVSVYSCVCNNVMTTGIPGYACRSTPKKDI